MQYLEERKHYEDRYDLLTINLCLDRIKLLKKVFAKIDSKPEEISQYSEDEKQRSKNYLANTQLLNIKLHRYKERDKTIEEWYESDRRKQDTQDNTPAPQNIKCPKCHSLMESTSHDLEDYLDKPLRVLFFFECPKCTKRQGVYENGEIWKYTPPICEKCGGELKLDMQYKGDITTTTTTCNKCDYKNVEKRDHKKQHEEWDRKDQEDIQLLSKYRKDFCMEKEEAEGYFKAFDEIAFANEVYEYELQKYDDNAYTKSENLKNYSIAELEDLLNSEISKEKFGKLNLKEPNLGEFVEVEFSVQEEDKTRTKRQSEYALQKLIKKILETTNWRLMSNGITYRLGYLTGTLKGYEKEEDILKLLGKKEEKPKKELDPEKLVKYSGSGAVGLARMSAEFEGKQRIRLKKFKDFPEGFLLNEDPDSSYTCYICKRPTRGNMTWWRPECITCTDCHNNILNGTIPTEVLGNDRLWFSASNISNEFDIHSATVRKYIRSGELIGKPLLNLEGIEYFTLFLTKDNKDFFESHIKKSDRKRRWNYIDHDGRVIWL